MSGSSDSHSANAKHIYGLATVESRRLDHAYIGTEHFLLALLRDRSDLPAETLKTCGVTRTRAIRAVESIVGRGGHRPGQPLPVTPAARSALRNAGTIAEEIGSPLIEPSHMLLGLLMENDSVAVAIVERLGADPAKVSGLLRHSLEADGRLRPAVREWTDQDEKTSGGIEENSAEDTGQAPI